MTHDELLAEIDSAELGWYYGWMRDSLRAVVELHKPEPYVGVSETNLICWKCLDKFGFGTHYPCPTIQAIEKGLG